LILNALNRGKWPIVRLANPQKVLDLAEWTEIGYACNVLKRAARCSYTELALALRERDMEYYEDVLRAPGMILYFVESVPSYLRIDNFLLEILTHKQHLVLFMEPDIGYGDAFSAKIAKLIDNKAEELLDEPWAGNTEGVDKGEEPPISADGIGLGQELLS